MFNSFYGETLKTYQNWVAGSFRSPAVPDRVRDYLLHLAVESPAGKYQSLWPHQRDAVLRAIFTNELLKPRDAGWKDLLLNVVTGGGKTTIIAAIMAYLRVCHEVRSFLLLSPNTIVRERLKTDFEKPSRDDSVWRRFNLFPPEFAHYETFEFLPKLSKSSFLRKQESSPFNGFIDSRFRGNDKKVRFSKVSLRA